MNRVSVRGIGIAAAFVAASSLAAGATVSGQTPPASLQDAATRGAFEATAADLVGQVPIDSMSAELYLARHARIAGLAGAHARAEATAAARARAAAKAAAARASAAKAAHVRAARATSVTRSYVRPIAPGSARALGARMVAARGWSVAQFECVDDIWTRESNWRVNAYNPNGGAYGIPQAQPGSKMGSAGSDWRDDAATQIAWGLGYIARTYGTPCRAWAFWRDHQWY